MINITRLYPGENKQRITIPTLVNDDAYVPTVEQFYNQVDDTVYPGFRPYFHLACLIFFGFLIIVLFDVSRKLCSKPKVRGSKLTYEDYRKV